MEQNETKETNSKNPKAKAVSRWAEAVENIAKAAVAVAGFVVCLILNYEKTNNNEN